MNYNIHPIFVHFPIALLVVYSCIKVIPLKRWFPNIAWKDVELVLLTVGLVGAFGGLITGESAESIVRPNHQLVETHATFASLSTWIYGALFVGDVAGIIIRYKDRLSGILGRIVPIARIVARIFDGRFVSVALPLIGLIAIMLTGLLGGVMVYGVSADPLAPFVLQVLGIVV